MVRRLFFIDRLLDGLVLEVDASTTSGGAACWIGARHVAHKNSLVAYVVTQWTEQDEGDLGGFHGVVGHSPFCDRRGAWENCVGRRRSGCLVKINEIAKEVAMHLALLGHELERVHIWSETNRLAQGLSSARQGLLAKRGAETWTFLKHLKDTVRIVKRRQGHSPCEGASHWSVCLTAQKL